MRIFLKPLWLISAFLLLLLGACGGGGGGGGTTATSTSSGSSGSSGSSTATPINYIPVSVDVNANRFNVPYVSVTICSPNNPGTCQTIDHILVDTGSSGLRIMSSTLNTSLNLPVQTSSGGNPIAECLHFASGYTWGSVRSANLQLGSESVTQLAIQVISDPAISTIPSTCSSIGTGVSTPAALGANGILGVGLFKTDCGNSCSSIAKNQVYYSCVSAVCSSMAQPLANQIQNPVSLFSQDYNGVILAINALSNPNTGQVSTTGTLIFGIDTQSNNASTNGTTLITNSGTGYISTLYNGQAYPSSFLDSGSNGLYFDDSSITQCATTGSTAMPGFYCPSSLLQLNAINTSANTTTASISFAIGNAASLFYGNPNFAVQPTIGGTGLGSGVFDWGLPFFYGKKVYTAIEGNTTTKGTGPYFGW